MAALAAPLPHLRSRLTINGDPASYSADLALALALADGADVASLARFRALDLVVETKPDLTPVSDADRAVEAAMRDTLAVERPHDALLGEEYGVTGDADRRWIVDPIDGTKNFVRGMPVWATLIALSDHDRVVVGVVSAPALGRRWWAARGEGAWTSDLDGSIRPCRVSQVSALSDAYLSYSSLNSWPEAREGGGIHGLLGQVWRSRAFGDFWSHVLVAEGALDVSCEPSVSLWDIAALQVIVEEAGGRFSDLAGEAHPDRGSILCTNGLLHDATVSLLQQ
ncbi:histidinol-phosphatase [Acidothermaceae bacterium B102]|nr:histidinol-phosphatase [Acidothermaceae bacterium B102]